MSSTLKMQTQAEREATFRRLYRDCFPAVARRLKQQGAQRAEAEDIFQDCLVILYEKNAEGKLPDLQYPRAYLGRIAQRLWMRRQNRQRMQPIDYQAEEQLIPVDFQPASNSEQRLLRILRRAGEQCMAILQAFYYQDQPLHEIAERFGFSSVRSATVQKYKCLQRIREFVHAKKKSYADLME